MFSISFESDSRALTIKPSAHKTDNGEVIVTPAVTCNYTRTELRGIVNKTVELNLGWLKGYITIEFEYLCPPTKSNN